MNELTEIDGRARRASERRESRRAYILDTALKVFARSGYHQTRISDIIEAAGIARGTFYLYFESKSAIFLELLDELVVELRKHIVGVEQGPGAAPVEVQLTTTVTRILETVESKRTLTTILMREAVGLDEVVDKKLQEFYGNLHGYIVLALVEGQNMGIVRALDTDIVASCILGTVKHVMERYATLDPGAAVDVERVGGALLDFNLRGVLQT